MLQLTRDLAKYVALATAVLSAAWPVVAGNTAPVRGGATEPVKKLYAHYMPCYPVAAMATAWHRANDAHKIRHDGTGQFDAIGDRWRNWPLVPDGMALTLVQSADLEIRRALRGGVDGFLFDAWAGGENGRKFFDAMFEAAEAKDYPFEIGICLDPSCLEGADKVQAAADAIRSVLDKHGKSPKLARRDGRPLVAGYNSIFIGLGYAERTLGSEPRWRGTKDLWKDPAFRTDPGVWQAYGQAYRAIERRVGQPIYFHVCMNAFFWRVDNSKWNQAMLAEGAGVMASSVGAVGEFLGGGPTEARMAAAVRAKGAEWSEPMFFQYENIGWGGNRISMGFDILRDRWKAARENGSTILQFVTWNDYTENTCLAPAYDTRYTILDLNAYFVQWWKTGREPAADHDRVYLSYRTYPKGAKIFPFRPKQPDAGGVLEVLTILPRPARVRVIGRGAEFDAPAGMFWRQFDLKPGPVIAEIVRDGRVNLRLESPEPITDRPFREQNGMTCYSSEFLRHWKADFGDAPPLLRGEYADDDHDGLPNWFEMYWFGKFLDWSTATAADPKALGLDGKSNLQHYLDQTEPVARPAAAKKPTP